MMVLLLFGDFSPNLGLMKLGITNARSSELAETTVLHDF